MIGAISANTEKSKIDCSFERCHQRRHLPSESLLSAYNLQAWAPFVQQSTSCYTDKPVSIPGNNQCFYFDQQYRWGFSPCLGCLVPSQFLRVKVWVWQDTDTFSLSGGNRPGNRWSKWASVMTRKHSERLKLGETLNAITERAVLILWQSSVASQLMKRHKTIFLTPWTRTWVQILWVNVVHLFPHGPVASAL